MAIVIPKKTLMRGTNVILWRASEGTSRDCRIRRASSADPRTCLGQTMELTV
jgi:hypothetical protein